jgi:hypothetical protein
LDYGEKCRAECAKPGNEKCIDTSVPQEERVENKEWLCTEWVVNTYQSVQCWGDGIEKSFYNVVFETTLIDSAKTVDWNNSWIKCPADWWNQNLINNKCVFQCIEGTHLRVNENEFTATDGKVIKEWEIWCFRDCKLDWEPIEHNQTIYGYNVREVTCSNHNYIFPEQFNLGNNLFTKLVGGISPETCGNGVW